MYPYPVHFWISNLLKSIQLVKLTGHFTINGSYKAWSSCKLSRWSCYTGYEHLQIYYHRFGSFSSGQDSQVYVQFQNIICDFMQTAVHRSLLISEVTYYVLKMHARGGQVTRVVNLPGSTVTILTH